MSFLVDTNIASAFLRGHRGVTTQFGLHAGALYTSSICVGELYSWVLRDRDRTSRLLTTRELLEYIEELPVDHAVAERFGYVRAWLLDQGRPVPATDLFIACTALHHGLTLVTANTKDFVHVPGLQLVNWLE